MSRTPTGLSHHRTSKSLSSTQGLWSIHFCIFLYPDPLPHPFRSCSPFQCGYLNPELEQHNVFCLQKGRKYLHLLAPRPGSSHCKLLTCYSFNECLFLLLHPTFPGSGSGNKIIDILLLSPHCFSFRNPHSFEVLLDCFHLLPPSPFALCLKDFSNGDTEFLYFTAVDVILCDFNIYIYHWFSNVTAHFNHLGFYFCCCFCLFACLFF